MTNNPTTRHSHRCIGGPMDGQGCSPGPNVETFQAGATRYIKDTVTTSEGDYFVWVPEDQEACETMDRLVVGAAGAAPTIWHYGRSRAPLASAPVRSPSDDAVFRAIRMAS